MPPAGTIHPSAPHFLHKSAMFTEHELAGVGEIKDVGERSFIGVREIILVGVRERIFVGKSLRGKEEIGKVATHLYLLIVLINLQVAFPAQTGEQVTAALL